MPADLKTNERERHRTIELSTRESLEIAKAITRKSGSTFDFDQAYEMVDSWYKDIQPKITNVSRVDLAHLIIVLCFGTINITEETVKANVVGMGKANPQAIKRLTKSLVEYENIKNLQ